MNIAIIGGSGFIGSHLAKMLYLNKVNFTLLDIKKSIDFPDLWVYCDITKQSDLRTNLLGFTHVINLAAEHKDDVSPISLYYDVNVTGSRNLCLVLKELGIKNIIFTSSVAVYGFVDHEGDEKTANHPFNHYGISKLQAEAVYREWQLENPENNLLIVRPTVVFGIGNRGNVYNLFKQIASGKFLMIGAGDNKKSMAYVENLVSFIVFMLDRFKDVNIINYVDKPDYTMNELTALICNSMGIPQKNYKIPYSLGMLIGYFFDFVSFITRKKFTISSIRVKKFCSSSQFKSIYIDQTSFTPPTCLKDAIEKTVKSEF